MHSMICRSFGSSGLSRARNSHLSLSSFCLSAATIASWTSSALSRTLSRQFRRSCVTFSMLIRFCAVNQATMLAMMAATAADESIVAIISVSREPQPSAPARGEPGTPTVTEIHDGQTTQMRAPYLLLCWRVGFERNPYVIFGHFHRVWARPALGKNRRSTPPRRHIQLVRARCVLKCSMAVRNWRPPVGPLWWMNGWSLCTSSTNSSGTFSNRPWSKGSVCAGSTGFLSRPEHNKARPPWRRSPARQEKWHRSRRPRAREGSPSRSIRAT